MSLYDLFGMLEESVARVQDLAHVYWYAQKELFSIFMSVEYLRKVKRSLDAGQDVPVNALPMAGRSLLIISIIVKVIDFDSIKDSLDGKSLFIRVSDLSFSNDKRRSGEDREDDQQHHLCYNSLFFDI